MSLYIHILNNMDMSSIKPVLLAGLLTSDETEDKDKVEEKCRFRVLPTSSEVTLDFSTAALNVSSTAMRLATASS